MTWEKLYEDNMRCRKCSLCETRTNLVFGVGNTSAKVMFIGEGPGQQEDLQGVPFVGAAGKLLDDMLSIIDLDRTQVYIANIVKCRPPGNRDPLAVEQDACIDWLRQQVKLINPRIIVCLGRIAAKRLLDSDFAITRQHGIWFERGNVHMMAMYHPAALLRDDTKKLDTFFDLKSLQKKILEVCPETYAPLDNI